MNRSALDSEDPFDCGTGVMNADEFECVIHNLPGVVLRCLPDREWTICFISEGITALTGYSAKDFLYNERRSLQDIIHPDDWADASERILATLGRQQSFSEELRILDAAGRVHWVFAKGQPVSDGDGAVLFVDGALIDITDRKLAEQALQEERENIRSMLANVPGIVYRTALGDDWTLEFVSDGVRDLFGVEPESFVGKGMEHYGAFVHPDDIERVARTITVAGARGEPYEVRYRVRDSAGTYRAVFEKGQSRAMAADGRRYLDGIILDVTRVQGEGGN